MKSGSLKRDHLPSDPAPLPDIGDGRDLEQSGEMAGASDFAGAMSETDWDQLDAAAVRRAIEMALRLELIALARRLAEHGKAQHPGDPYFSNIAAIIAPPRVLNAHLPPVPGVSASMEWLERHAGEYRGQWIAVRSGEFLGADSSRQQLITKLGDGLSPHDTLITRIP